MSPKRAAIIITDAGFIEWFDPVPERADVELVQPSEQLLADLRTLINVAHDEGSADEMDAADRVRDVVGDTA